jgi:hypothetical protein
MPYGRRGRHDDRTERPLALSKNATLERLVLLPTPLTPTKTITNG